MKGYIMPPLMFANIAWSNSYEEPEPDEFFSNADHYILDEFAELWNFAEHDSFYYGYVPTPPHWCINLDSLGGDNDAKYTDGITVVWTAPHPENGGRVIIGWYNDARVYSTYKDRPKPIPLQYIIKAKCDNCTLLPIDNRYFEIPTNYRYIWYAKEKAEFRTKVLKYIQDYKETQKDKNRRKKRLTGKGGEGDDHRLLKEWVAEHPEEIGLKNVKATFVEYPFLSGDRVDILFKLEKKKYTVVEIETFNPLPGCHQVLKYKVLKCIELGLDTNSENVECILVAKTDSRQTKQLCDRYNVKYVTIK